MLYIRAHEYSHILLFKPERRFVNMMYEIFSGNLCNNAFTLDDNYHGDHDDFNIVSSKFFDI